MSSVRSKVAGASSSRSGKREQDAPATLEANPGLTPKLRFPEFRDDPGWLGKRIGEICRLYQAETISSAEFVPSGAHLVYGANGVVGRLDRYNHEAEEVIVSCRGICGEVHFTQPRSWITGNSMVVTPQGDEIQKPFLYRLLGAADLKPIVSGSAQPQITRQGFSPFLVHIPSPAEQQKIAECLSTLDELIGAESQKLDALKAHKKGLMQQLFPREGETLPRLRFPEFHSGAEWKTHSLGPKTIKVGSGITPTGGDKNYKREGRLFMRSQNVGWGVLLLDDVAFIDEETHRSFDATEIKTSDVLLNITGASIGRSAIADERLAGGNVNQHVCIIRVKPEELNPIFLNQFLLSQHGQKQIDSFQAGGNRQGLNFAQIRSFSIPLPPTPAEQHRIATCLSSLDELIAAQSDRLSALQTHKQGLLQQLFPSPADAEA